MKVVGVIPARYESSRFPGKPLIDLKGKSMIQRVYEGVLKSDLFSEVIVATDDQRIFDAVNSFGGKAAMTSSDHRTGTDRCAEVAVSVDADVIVNIQGDEPLIDHRQLDELCSAFHNEEVKIATLGIVMEEHSDMTNINRIKLVVDHAGDAMYFSRSPIPNIDNAKPAALKDADFYRHIGVYAFRKKDLLDIANLEPTCLEKLESLEQLRWMYYGYKIRVVETDIETPNIDTPDDVAKVLAKLG